MATVRDDTRNVNNWHWVEKNAEPWSRTCLNELLIGQTIEKGPLKVQLKEFKKLEGDATANNRKAKLIFLYDWQIEISFSATVSGSELEYKGVLEIPNLSDENDADEIDLNVIVETRGPHEAELRHLLNNQGLKFIRKQLGIYIKKLKEEFSKGLILKTDVKQVVVKEGAKSGVFDKRSFQNEVITEKSAQKVPEKVEITSFEISESFKVPPPRLYEILTQPELVKAWAGTSSIDPKVGGQFTFFGGQITGSFVSLKENEELVVKWRLKDYPQGHFAEIKFTLQDQGDSTCLKLEGTDIPTSKSENTQEGLKRHYFQNIGRSFGCALRMF